MTHRPHRALVLALALAAGCQSTRDSSAEKAGDAPVMIHMDPEDPIGKLLADLDQAIARWSALTLTARNQREQREQRMLQQFLEDRTVKRREDLVQALVAGPPINRVRAAAALGFTHAIEAQSPLLNALHDPDPDVVHNALLGLAILARADTPLSDVCNLAEESNDAATRGQAAYALRAIVQAGGSGDCVQPTARRGLIDKEPFVRSQCALLLGLLGDEESVPALVDRMHDEVQLVSAAAAEGLILIAKDDQAQKGPVGRGLVGVYTTAKDPLKERAHAALVQISDVNYGDDDKLWLEWAERLP